MKFTGEFEDCSQCGGSGVERTGSSKRLCPKCRGARVVRRSSLRSKFLRRTMPPFAKEHETSRAAALEIYDEAPNIRERVLNEIRERGGAMAWEIQKILDISGDTVRPRIWELRKAGLVYDDGQVGLTPTGRKAIIWLAVAA